METKIFKIDNENIEKSCMEEMGKIIRDGGLVAFPTETVYGLGADATNEDAVKKIFEAKGRPADNPLIVHFAEVQAIDEICYVTESAKRVLEKFSPGPITVILKKKSEVSSFVTAGLDTVAVRIPSNETARALIKAAKRPIAAPSANLSGSPSPTIFRDVYDDMFGRIDAIIDGCDCDVGVESTIIDLSGDKPIILRPGKITLSDIKTVLPDALVDPHILEIMEAGKKPRCPGMKYKHYAPRAEVIVVEGKKDAVRKKIEELISQNKDKQVGVFYMGESYDADVLIFAGEDNKEYARKLFRALREFDRKRADVIFAEFIRDDEDGLAVKNRLYKAAANRVIYV